MTTGRAPLVKPRVETFALPLDEKKEKEAQEWEPRVTTAKAMFRTDGMQYPVIEQPMKNENLPGLIARMGKVWKLQPSSAVNPSEEEEKDETRAKNDEKLMSDDDDCAMVSEYCERERIKKELSGVKRLLNSGHYFS